VWGWVVGFLAIAKSGMLTLLHLIVMCQNLPLRSGLGGRQHVWVALGVVSKKGVIREF